MLLTLKDKAGNIIVKDMLDIDFDMSVQEENGKYCVNVNHRWRLSEEFASKDDAVEEMISIANGRNSLEREFRSF